MRAVVKDDGCHVSGVTGHDRATMTIPEGIADQARPGFITIRAVRAQAGSAGGDLGRLCCIVSDAARMDERVPVLGAARGTVRPAATRVIAGLIRPEMKIEIAVTALRGERTGLRTPVRTVDRCPLPPFDRGQGGGGPRRADVHP